jgi:hypothetical protein
LANKYDGSCSEIENQMKPLVFVDESNQRLIVNPKNYLIDKDG